jgi:prolyl-tRNA synthetase
VESGRYDGYGKEMLRMKDRHDRDILFGPTAEEVITDIFRKNINSYKDLPKNLYQIHWKFRDEIRPRFGVMRGREFLMKDGYSFDLNEEEAKKTYNRIYETYFKIFKKMGLKAIALRADTGAIGGDLSHEFHILAQTGESAIYYDKKFDEISKQDNFDVAKMQSIYAMADEMHDEKNCPIAKENLVTKRGIEVGHIFNFGTKYSKAMNASVVDSNGKAIFPNMGSYGIGVSRIVGAIIEGNNDEKGIIWPSEVAPFQVALINLKVEDETCNNLCEEIYQNLKKQGIDALYDDTKNSVGQKLSTADLIGIPKQIVIGPKLAKERKFEEILRKSGQKVEKNVDEILK